MIKKILITLLIILFSSLVLSLIVIGKKLQDTSKELANLKANPSVEYKNFPSKYVGEHVLSFYTHTGYRTASGVYPKAGRTVAVDTRVIPHGTLLYIEGVGYRVAEDTGADIKGRRIDVFVDTRDEAISLGIKKRKVYILN